MAELLPGLQMSLDTALALFNVARAELKLLPMRLTTEPEPPELKRPAANRRNADTHKEQLAEPLRVIEAAGMKIKGKRPTEGEARKARQKLARRKFKALDIRKEPRE